MTAPTRPTRLTAAALLLAAAGLGGASAKPAPASPDSPPAPAAEARAIAEVLLDRTTLTATGPGAYVLDRVLEVRVHTRAAAERFRYASAYYDDHARVEELTGSVQGPDDERPDRARKRDLVDYAAYDGMSIALSGRIRALTLPLPSGYPAVYRTHSRREVRESVYVPAVAWDYGPEVAVVRGELVVEGDAREILHEVVDPEGLVAEERLAGGGRRFGVSHLPAREAEDFAPGADVAGPAVLLAPRSGRLEGTAGDFATWAGLGAWTADLLADRDELPAAAIAEVRALVDGVGDPRERVRLVYDYMQRRTHYVSIQLGIGGFKPMDPADVHAGGYGDCKALANYTRLLLGAADVDSYYCVIGVRGKEISRPGFASVNQANHAMLAATVPGPAGPDTLWLECTDQTMPADFAGGFTWAAGRRALLVKDGTGELVRVPGGRPTDNPITSRTEVVVAPDGSAALTRETHYRGAAVEVPWRLARADAPERKRLARARFAISTDGLDPAVSIRQTPTGPEGVVREEVRLPSLARRLGERLAVPAFAYLAPPPQPRDTADRLRPFAFDEAYRRVDSVRFVLPEGHGLTAAPRPVDLEAPHARYRLAATPQPDGSLLAVRELELRRGVYPASDAPAIAAFYAGVRRADGGLLASAPGAEGLTAP